LPIASLSVKGPSVESVLLLTGVQNRGVQSSFTTRPAVDEIKLSEANRNTAHKQLSHRTGKLELAAPQLLANQAIG
jgi:hypothetical protein